MTHKRTNDWTCDDALAAMMDGAAAAELGPTGTPQDAGLASHVAQCAGCGAAWEEQRITRAAMGAVEWPEPAASIGTQLRAIPSAEESDALGSEGPSERGLLQQVRARWGKAPTHAGKQRGAHALPPESAAKVPHAAPSAGSPGREHEPRLRRTRRLEIGLALGAVAGVALALARAFATMPEATVVQPQEDATATAAQAVAATSTVAGPGATATVAASAGTATADHEHALSYQGPLARNIKVVAETIGEPADGYTIIGVVYEPSIIDLPWDVAESAAATETLRLPDIDVGGWNAHHTIDIPVDPPLSRLHSVRAHVYVLPDEQLPPPGTWLLVAEASDRDTGLPLAEVRIGLWTSVFPWGTHPLERSEQPWQTAQTDADGQGYVRIPWSGLVEQLGANNPIGRPLDHLPIEFAKEIFVGDAVKDVRVLNLPDLPYRLTEPVPSPDDPPDSWLGPPAGRVSIVRSKDLPAEVPWANVVYTTTLTGALPAGYLLRTTRIEPAGYTLEVDAEIAARLNELARTDANVTRTWSDRNGVLYWIDLQPVSLSGRRHTTTERLFPVASLEQLGVPTDGESEGITVTLDVVPAAAHLEGDETGVLIEVQDATGRYAAGVPVALVVEQLEASRHPDAQVPPRIWSPDSSIDATTLTLASSATDAEGYAVLHVPRHRGGELEAQLRSLSGFDSPPNGGESLVATLRVHAGSDPVRFVDRDVLEFFNDPSHAWLRMGLPSLFIREIRGGQATAAPPVPVAYYWETTVSNGRGLTVVRLQLSADGAYAVPRP